jgi:hypothetical protein
MYASAVRSFGIRGNLAILGHVDRWRSKDGCIQDAVDPLSEQRVFAPEMPQNPSGNRRPNRSGAANPRRLLLET